MTAITAAVAHDPFLDLERITDRGLSALTPIFVAMSATWTPQIAPERVLRSLVLMAFFDLGDEKLLCREIDARSAFRRFLHVEPLALGSVDPAALRQGLERMAHNYCARDFLRAVVAAAQDAGLMGQSVFSPNEALIRRWTANAASDGVDPRRE